MKIFLLMLCPVLGWTAGPIYQHDSAVDQQEFENVYHDIASPKIGTGSAQSLTLTSGTVSSLAVSTITAVSSATITNLTVTNLSGVTLGKVRQIVTANDSTGGSTSSASFVDLGPSATITPTSASSQIIILIGFSWTTGAATNQSSVGISRAGTDLVTTGTTPVILQWFTTKVIPLSMLWVDSPATTSATTYKTRISSTGGVTTFVGNGAATGSLGKMTLIEVGP